MKVLIANIAFGIPGMQNLWTNTLGHLAFHGWSMIPFFLAPKTIENRVALPNPRRVHYLRRNCDLGNTLRMLRRENADIVMLNEVIPQIYKPKLEAELSALGYRSIYWGRSSHYPDTTVTSLVATKAAAEAVPSLLPQAEHPGGGGGMAMLRSKSFTAIAVHMTVGAKFPRLYARQIDVIAEAVRKEQAAGRKVIVGGDWNESAAAIRKYPAFAELDLVNVEGDVGTCPTFLPWLKPLDHIFVSGGWKALDVQTVEFGSDHLALAAKLAA